MRTLALATALCLSTLASSAIASPPGLLLGVLTGASATVPGATAAERRAREVRRHMILAEFYLVQEQDPDAAAAEYQAALKLDRKHVDAALGLAGIKRSKGDFKGALRILKALTRANKKNASAFHELGVASWKAGDTKGARKAFEQALRIDPDHADARRAMIGLLLDRYRGGEEKVKAELVEQTEAFLERSDLDHGRAYQAIARLHAELVGGAAALRFYDAKAAYEAAWTEGQFGRINALMGEARSGFEACVQAEPDNEQCHYYLGLVHASVKASDHYDLAAARDQLEAAPDVPEAHVELALMARKEDDIDTAEDELKRALELDAESQRAHLELGVLYKLDGRDDEAVDQLTAAWAIDSSAAAADRAVQELSTIRPEHELVQRAMLYGEMKGDPFSTEKFKGVLAALEEGFGGVDPDAPEKAVLEEILRRIVDANDIDATYDFRIAVLNSSVVNAFAVPNGRIYFTKGFFDFTRRAFPDKPIDADNDVIAHVMAHEMVHVLRRHIVRSLVYQEAVADASKELDPAILTHVTRIHEIEADREGIVLAFLAGYDPRGGVLFMEANGKEHEIPRHLDHPTFDERIHYLEEYWSNDVKYAWSSFHFGTQKLEEARQAEEAEAVDIEGAQKLLEDAIDDFKRFRTTLKATKQVLNNLGLAYVRLGVIAMAEDAGLLARWRTWFSVERDAGIRYVAIREKAPDKGPGSRGAGEEVERKIPWQITQAIALFQEAIEKAPDYHRARLNLAAALLAKGDLDAAKRTLDERKPGADESQVANLAGIIASEQGRHGDAIKAFRQAMKGGGALALASFNLGRAYERAGKEDEAEDAYGAYLKRFPRGPWADAAHRALEDL